MAGPEQVAATDTAAGSQATAVQEAADSLLDYLCGCKYLIGVDHYLRVHRLLASLAGCGQLPQRARDLELWVRPLICESAREQERFAKDFEDWLRARGEAVAEYLPPEEPVRESLREVKRGWTRWIVIGGLAFFVLAAAIGLWLSRALGFTPQTESRVSEQLGYGFGFGLGSVAILVALASLVIVPALLWRRSKTKAFLVQREAKGPSSSTSLAVASVDPPIYDSRLLSLAAQGFGIYRRLPSEDLNLPASVAATAREAGRFTPILAERPAVPEYLVLIDRGSTADVFARFAAGIVQKLEDSNVVVDVFYFDRSPQQCYGRRAYRPVTIGELGERFPEHRLMVFSDGGGFLSPVANQYAPWMEVFANWETKTLLTPNPRDYWGARESIIAEAGWTVIPAEQEEVAALAHEVEPEKAEEGFVPGLLGSVTARGNELLQRSAPPADELQELLTDLRVSLGAAGFHWLCACAAYPAIDWIVTLYLGANLRDQRGKTLLRETGFLALARLPWFRHGRMPEWLRLALLAKLSGEQLQEVRQALQMLLVSGAAGPVSTYRLEIHSDLRRPLTWLTRQFIRSRLPRLDDEDPLRDQVFVEFLSGGNPAALPLPERIANLFRGGTPGEWLGHSKLVWKLIGLALVLQFASQSVQTRVSLPVFALVGISMLARGLVFNLYRHSGAGHSVMAGSALLLGASAVNAFSGDYVSFGMTKIGFGLLWPGIAVMISRASGPVSGRVLSALALWSVTAYVPALFPGLALWAKLATVAVGAGLLWNMSGLWEISDLNVQFRSQTANPRAFWAKVFALLAVAAGLKSLPPWTMTCVLGALCLWSFLYRVRPRGGPFWGFYLTGLLYWTAAVAGLNLLLHGASFRARNVPIVLIALLMSWAWRRGFIPNWREQALAYSFCLLAGGFALGALAPSLGLAGVLIAAAGQPLTDTVGVWVPLSSPVRTVGLAVALWLALGQLGDSLWLELPIPQKLPPGLSLAVCSAVALISAVLVWRVGLQRRAEAVREPASALVEVGWGPRMVAALSHFMFAIAGLIVPVVTTVQAARGKLSRLPIIGRLAALTLSRAAPSISPETGKAPEGPLEQPMVRKKLIAFVSSTFDLWPEREAVRSALANMGMEITGPEFFTAELENMGEHMMEAVSRSDLFIIIIRDRYGLADPDSGLSMIELEYNEARRARIPRLIFMKKSENVERPEAERGRRFKERLIRSNVVRLFETSEELGRKAIVAVQELLGEAVRPSASSGTAPR